MRAPGIIVIGASAGGVPALTRVVADLPADLPAAVFVVLHLAPTSAGVLPQILGRRARLPVTSPADGDPIEAGWVSVARPNRHLLLERCTIRVTDGPRENGFRPSIDSLFRSAAVHHGPAVVGVVLSGSLDDGTAGLRLIHEYGGCAVVQDPDDALFPGMPRSAVNADNPEFVLPADKIGYQLAELAAKLARQTVASPPAPAKPTDPEGAKPRDALESALWTAYRTLRERVALCLRLADRAAECRAELTAEHYRAEAAAGAQKAEHLRSALFRARGGQDERDFD